MKCNTFTLKCFLQFTCANLDGSQKEGGNFLNLLQKEGGTQKGGGGVPSEKRGSNPEGNYVKYGIPNCYQKKFHTYEEGGAHLRVSV